MWLLQPSFVCSRSLWWCCINKSKNCDRQMLNENGGTGIMELDNNVWSRAETGTMKNVPNLSPLSSCALSASSILSLSTPLLVKTKLPICRRISSFVLKSILCLCAKGCPVRAKMFLICRTWPFLFFWNSSLYSFFVAEDQVCSLAKSPSLISYWFHFYSECSKFVSEWLSILFSKSLLICRSCTVFLFSDMFLICRT